MCGVAGQTAVGQVDAAPSQGFASGGSGPAGFSGPTTATRSRAMGSPQGCESTSTPRSSPTESVIGPAASWSARVAGETA